MDREIIESTDERERKIAATIIVTFVTTGTGRSDQRERFESKEMLETASLLFSFEGDPTPLRTA